MSWPIAHAAFITHVTGFLEADLPAVTVLGIEETRRGKPFWAPDPVTGRWRVVHDRWHTGIVDAAGTGGLLAHIEGRTAARVTEWLTAQPEPWRAGTTHVTIDLSASYAKAVTDALPDAILVADRFHLVQLANTMLTEVRQHATREVRGRRGRKKDPECSSNRAGAGDHERASRSRARSQSHRGSHSWSPTTAQHHQAANAILTVTPPPATVASLESLDGDEKRPDNSTTAAKGPGRYLTRDCALCQRRCCVARGGVRRGGRG